MKYCFILILTLQSIFVFGQSKKQRLAPPPPSLSDTINEVSKKTDFIQYDVKKRRGFYPFNKASYVKLVSFDKQLKEDIRLKTLHTDATQTAEYIKVYGLPMQSDTIDFSKILQSTILNKIEIDSLSDILYNTCSRWTLTETTKAGCYFPHNAIIFFNSKNQPFEYIEFCFDCNQLKYSSKKIKKIVDCDIAFSELEEYFKAYGLKTRKNEFEMK